MKKRIIINEADKDLTAGKGRQPDHIFPYEPADVDSIEEFIKKRKLQNHPFRKESSVRNDIRRLRQISRSTLLRTLPVL